MQPVLSIILPAYNEAERLPTAIEKISRHFNQHDVAGVYEIVVVENGSTDKTLDVAMKTALEIARRPWPNIKVKITRSHKGKGAAIRKGIETATGQDILITDVDLSTPIEYYYMLLRAIHYKGADLAIASRRATGARVINNTAARKAASLVFSLLARPLTPGIKDTQCGFKLICGATAKKLLPRLAQDGYTIDIELIHAAQQQGYKVIEVPVTWYNDPDSRVRLIPDSLGMIRELLTIRANSIRGRYEKISLDTPADFIADKWNASRSR